MQGKEDSKIKFNLGPTQEAFSFSDALMSTIIGNMGEGKTFAGVIVLIHHARKNGKPMCCVIIGDTHKNIKTAAARSVKNVLGDFASLKKDYGKLTIYRKPSIIVDLLGIEDPNHYQNCKDPNM